VAFRRVQERDLRVGRRHGSRQDRGGADSPPRATPPPSAPSPTSLSRGLDACGSTRREGVVNRLRGRPRHRCWASQREGSPASGRAEVGRPQGPTVWVCQVVTRDAAARLIAASALLDGWSAASLSRGRFRSSVKRSGAVSHEMHGALVHQQVCRGGCGRSVLRLRTVAGLRGSCGAVRAPSADRGGHPCGARRCFGRVCGPRARAPTTLDVGSRVMLDAADLKSHWPLQTQWLRGVSRLPKVSAPTASSAQLGADERDRSCRHGLSCCGRPRGSGFWSV
jgi:hypothetical protein